MEWYVGYLYHVKPMLICHLIATMRGSYNTGAAANLNRLLDRGSKHSFTTSGRSLQERCSWQIEDRRSSIPERKAPAQWERRKPLSGSLKVDIVTIILHRHGNRNRMSVRLQSSSV